MALFWRGMPWPWPRPCHGLGYVMAVACLGYVMALSCHALALVMSWPWLVMTLSWPCLCVVTALVVTCHVMALLWLWPWHALALPWPQPWHALPLVWSWTCLGLNFAFVMAMLLPRTKGLILALTGACSALLGVFPCSMGVITFDLCCIEWSCGNVYVLACGWQMDCMGWFDPCLCSEFLPCNLDHCCFKWQLSLSDYWVSVLHTVWRNYDPKDLEFRLLLLCDIKMNPEVPSVLPRMPLIFVVCVVHGLATRSLGCGTFCC